MDTPIVFNASSFPRQVSKPRLSFRFDKGEIGLTKGLYDLLQIDDKQRVVFVNYKKGWYIARTDTGGFWLTVTNQTSFTISNKSFAQQFLRELGYGPGDTIRIPVAPHEVLATELELSTEQHSYPFYRVAVDQSKLKL